MTTHASGDLSPSWAPSGRELAFASDRSGGPQVFLMSADGTNVRRLTFEGDYNAAPAWSPRGNWIAYVCRTPKKEYKLCLITPDGQKRVQLTAGPGVEDSPSWSPDGRHLVFVRPWMGRANFMITQTERFGRVVCWRTTVTGLVAGVVVHLVDNTITREAVSPDMGDISEEGANL